MGEHNRAERLQIMLTDYELKAVDDWRFGTRMPSRAAAVRELLQRGLAADGFNIADRATQSKDFGVVGQKPAGHDEGEKPAGPSGKQART